MAMYEWDTSYAVNVREFDSDHQKLFDLVNTLHEAMKAGKAKDILMSIFSDLETYTKSHFKREELAMQKYSYPELSQQRTEHHQFITAIAEQKAKFNKTGISTAMQIMSFLTNWLTKHIMRSDKKYGPFLNEHGMH